MRSALVQLHHQRWHRVVLDADAPELHDAADAMLDADARDESLASRDRRTSAHAMASLFSSTRRFRQDGREGRQVENVLDFAGVPSGSLQSVAGLFRLQALRASNNPRVRIQEIRVQRELIVAHRGPCEPKEESMIEVQTFEEWVDRLPGQVSEPGAVSAVLSGGARLRTCVEDSADACAIELDPERIDATRHRAVRVDGAAGLRVVQHASPFGAVLQGRAVGSQESFARCRGADAESRGDPNQFVRHDVDGAAVTARTAPATLIGPALVRRHRGARNDVTSSSCTRD
jgi:hypothetical protein